MSGWLSDDATDWHGRPVARRVADAADRRRAVLAGVVRAVVVDRGVVDRGRRTGGVRAELGQGGPGTALEARLDDGTGSITLRWLGRDAIAGVQTGVRLEVEGTVSRQSGRLVILNPLYRFAGSTRSDATDGQVPTGTDSAETKVVTHGTATAPVVAPATDEAGDGPGDPRVDVQAETSTNW